MPEYVPCNLCGADDARRLFRLRDYRMRVDDLEWTAVRCRICGLGYRNPRPDAEESKRYYPAEYFSERGSHLERYRRLAGYVPGIGGRLLDIGTARGDFLSLMAERGWAVEGVEPAEQAGNPDGHVIHRMPFPE